MVLIRKNILPREKTDSHGTVYINIIFPENVPFDGETIGRGLEQRIQNYLRNIKSFYPETEFLIIRRVSYEKIEVGILREILDGIRLTFADWLSYKKNNKRRKRARHK
jgi:hypothetical protein